MISGLVSVITPCYNTGKYLPTLLDSVLRQTYPYIEMIAVDDGSTDDTAEIVKEFIPQFEKKGFSLCYVKQDNSGQSVAIQRGIDMIKGEYLVWPDSDDYYASEQAIEKMVERMRSMPADVAMVRTQELLVEDNPEHDVVGLFGENAAILEPATLFEDCLFGNNGFYFCAGAYMVRVESLSRSTRFPIYTEKNAGQNWQLMLPVLYHYRCSTILEPLYCVVQRLDSHSRGQYTGYDRLITKYTTYYDTVISTLGRIIDMDKIKYEYYCKEIHGKYLTILLRLSIERFDKRNSKKYCRSLAQKSIPVAFRDRLKVALLCLGVLPLVVRIKRRFWRDS